MMPVKIECILNHNHLGHGMNNSMDDFVTPKQRLISDKAKYNIYEFLVLIVIIFAIGVFQ